MYSGKLVFFGQDWFYSDKSGYNRVKVVVFGQGDCIRAKWLSTDKTGCIRVKRWLYSGKSSFIRERTGCTQTKWLYSGKVVVFEQKLLYSSKVLVLGQK